MMTENCFSRFNGYEVKDAEARKAIDQLENFTNDIPVTPQMFGAVADGVSDDTDAVIAAIESGNTIHFPTGTYLVTRTIHIPSGKHLTGDWFGGGSSNPSGSKIKFTGTGYLIESEAEYNYPLIIERLLFEGNSTNSFIKCANGSWGVCVVMRDFYVYGFGVEWLHLESAFRCYFDNGSFRSSGKCVITTFEVPTGTTATEANISKYITNNFSNLISFNNCYIANRWSSDSDMVVMFELFRAYGLRFYNCALEHCEVMFKDFHPDWFVKSALYDKNISCAKSIDLTCCWMERVDSVYDFKHNSEVPYWTRARVAIQPSKWNANVSSGELDIVKGRSTGHYRNGETSSIFSAIHGAMNVYDSATIVNDTDGNGDFYPYIIASNHAQFNVPLNCETIESTNGKSVSYNLRNLARSSKVCGHYKVYVFAHYGSGNINVWEADVLSYTGSTTTYLLIKSERVYTQGSGAAETANEVITNANGALTFTTDTAALKVAMIVEYNFNHQTAME